MNEYIVKYRYRRMKRWDHNELFRSKEEFEKRIAEDIEHGHRIVEDKDGCFCYINV